jgi:endonuclease/exonuclease/phosphatase (EEP) superfamily protein YafD
MYGGVVLYLVALSGLRRRNVGAWNRQRLVVSALVVSMLPLVWSAPAIVALAALAVLLLGLIVFETVHQAVAREQVRHAAEH